MIEICESCGQPGVLLEAEPPALDHQDEPGPFKVCAGCAGLARAA